MTPRPRVSFAAMPNPVSHISDTARWVAMYRALESERPDALFRDPHARRLAGPQGEAILRHLPGARKFAWPMIVRTAVMDEIIVRAVQRDGVDTVYLEAEQVGALARDLHAQPVIRHWLIDLATPRVLEMMKRSWGKQLTDGKSPLRFGPAEGTAFFKPLGWREAEFRSTWDESFRLNRTVRFGRVFRFLGRLSSKRKQEEARRMAGIVLLGRHDG